MLSEAFKGMDVTLVGGIHKADYISALHRVGFRNVYWAKEEKDIRKIRGYFAKSDLAILVTHQCSHKQQHHAEKASEEFNKPFFKAYGAPKPQALLLYLIENYDKIIQAVTESI